VVANQQMSAAWNGPESVHYVDHADRHDLQLAQVTHALIERAAPSASDRVLDVGSGAGVTSFAAARHAASVLGVDISEPLTRVANDRAVGAGLDTTGFVVADAQTHTFDEASFDLIISQFGLMFFDDPLAAMTNVRRSLQPGGRLVFACWQGLRENEWLGPVARAVAADAEVPDLGGLANGGGMFAFRYCDEVVELLESGGFCEVDVAPVSPTLLIGGGGTVDETATFLLGLGIVRGLMGRLDEEQRARAERVIRAELEQHHRDGDGVHLGSGVWLVTSTA
jgi:ubiquinone/menaquinone biosynthesis C-methylase UbiE